MRFRLMLLVALCAPVGTAIAAPTPSSPATMALTRLSIDERALQNALGRKALAVAIKAYCDEIKSVYPQNSPSEDIWLDGEVQAGGDRPMRVLTSPEWGRRQAKFFTDGCTSWSADLEKTPDKSRSFVALAYTFLRFSSDADLYARKNGLDADKYGLPFTLRFTTQSLLVAALTATQ